MMRFEISEKRLEDLIDVCIFAYQGIEHQPKEIRLNRWTSIKEVQNLIENYGADSDALKKFKPFLRRNAKESLDKL